MCTQGQPLPALKKEKKKKKMDFVERLQMNEVHAEVSILTTWLALRKPQNAEKENCEKTYQEIGPTKLFAFTPLSGEEKKMYTLHSVQEVLHHLSYDQRHECSVWCYTTFWDHN